MIYKINSTENISDKNIDQKIFQKEKVDYVIVEREDQIDHLIDWISEAPKDKQIMKEDLKYLMSFNDEYILSSITTNEYIRENSKRGQNILSEIYHK